MVNIGGIVKVMLMIFIVSLLVPIFSPMARDGLADLKDGETEEGVNTTIDAVILLIKYFPVLVLLIEVIVLVVIAIGKISGKR